MASFPQGWQQTTHATSLDATAKRVALAAAALGVYLYLGRLSSSPLQTGNEAMYAYPAITMLETRDYLVPRFENGDFLEKPSPTWWPIVASYRMFGISVAAERLPGALAALLTIVAVFLWVRRSSGERAAAFAALVLLFTYSFWTFTRYSAADVFLALAVTLAVFALDDAFRTPETGSGELRRGALAGCSLALAFYTKGLTGFVLPIGAVGLGLLLDRVRPARLLSRGGAALLVFLALLAPWHWAMAHRLGPRFWRSFYWENQFLRGATTLYMHPRGLLFYLPVLAFTAFPWSFLLPQSLRRGRSSSMPLAWLCFGFVFWSLLVMKREVYLMPLFPAMAILIGKRLDREASGEMPRARIAWAAAAAVTALAVVLVLATSRFFARLLGWDALLALLVAASALLFVLVAGARSAERIRIPVATALACALVFLSLELLDERINRYDPIPAWGERVRRECVEGCDAFYVDLNVGQQEFYSRFDWVPLGRPRELVGRTRHRKGFLLMKTSDEGSLLELPIPWEVVERRLWLAGNWMSAAWKPNRSPLESLSLVRITLR